MIKAINPVMMGRLAWASILHTDISIDITATTRAAKLDLR
jgi:hypothetical protein